MPIAASDPSPLDIHRGDAQGFETLYELGRSLIPRYAPRWTDHNLHDPGITLLDLIAWLVDLQIYQVGFISDRHFEAFASLLGVRRRLATPARGLVWPHDDELGPILQKGVNVAEGTLVTCVEQPAIPFQVKADVYITPARLVQSGYSGPSVAGLNKIRAARPLCPQDGGPGVAELRFPQPLVEAGSNEQAFPVSLGVELAADPQWEPPSRASYEQLVVDYRAGNGPWRRLHLEHDGTYALNRTGVVRLRIPASPAGTPSALRLYTRERINPLPPKIKYIALNVVEIEQSQTHGPTVLGSATDLPDQSFELTLDGRVAEEVTIEVEEGGRFNKWTQTTEIGAAKPSDEVYEVRAGENLIVFGNGINGRIPPQLSQIRYLPYKRSLGSDGNLAVNLNWRIPGPPTAPGRNAYGTNRAPLSGGEDAWDNKKLREEARKAAVQREALLTNAHLLQAAQELGALGLDRAELPQLFHPALPQVKVRGGRTLIVVPKRAPTADPLEDAAPAFIDAVDQALRPRRVLGERLSIHTPERVEIRIRATLLVDDGFATQDVRSRAVSRVNEWLTDLQPEGAKVNPRPVGLDVGSAEIEAILSMVEGVVAVQNCRLGRGGGAPSASSVQLMPDEMAIGSKDHDLEARLLAQPRR